MTADQAAAAAADTAEAPGEERDLLPRADARTVVRHLAGLVRRRRALALGALVAFVAGAAAGLAPPYLLGVMVDRIIAGRGDLVGPTLGIGLSAVAAAGFAVLAVDLLARVVEPTMTALRGEVLDGALAVDAERVERAGSGDLLSRVGDDSRLVTTTATELVPEVAVAALTVVLTAFGMLALDWRLGLAGLLTVPFYVAAVRWYLPRSAPLYAEERTATGERAEAVIGALQGLHTLRAYRVEAAAAERARARSAATARISLRVFDLFGRFGGRMNGTELVGLLSILVTGFVLVDQDAATVGQVTTAALFFHRLFNPIGTLLFVFDQLQSAAASLSRMVGVALLRRPPSEDDDAADADADAEVGRTAPGDLVATGVGHAYRHGRPVLADVDLVARPGQRVALVGASGAGKTTLAAVLAGSMHPTQGRVSLGGVPLDELTPVALRLRICMVSQEVHVFAGTVRRNLLLAGGAGAGAGDHDLTAALRRVGALAWVEGLPDGLDTVVGEHGHAVDPGRAQQLALARVLLADPEVVVLDEATAEAGSRGASDLERAAAEVTRGRTAVVVAHRLSQAADADVVLVLDHGRVVESGSHDDLVAAGGRYARLWSAWHAGRS